MFYIVIFIDNSDRLQYLLLLFLIFFSGFQM